MSLYDDIIISGNEKSEIENESKEKSWSNVGINLLKDHLQSKKSSLNKRENKKPILFHGFSMKSKEDSTINISSNLTKTSGTLLGGEWDVTQEYDPLWPNDYEKIIKEKKEKEMNEAKLKELDERIKRKRDNTTIIGMSSRPLVDAYSDDEDDEKPSKYARGAAFAPPPSVLEDTTVVDKDTTLKVASSMGVSSVAAKIMVKMGYKEGQGLGKEEQGISRALEVQKTSQRGGKIINSELEKDVFLPPPPPPPPPPPASAAATNTSLSPSFSTIPTSNQIQIPAESITEIMKNPTKIVLLKNMVGKGEVDEDLEPEVKEECAKYGEVVSCVIFEMPPDAPEDEAVRIFVEFKRVESAIKAVVDLNGRYFGGRVVKALFYDVDKFKSLQLKD